MSLKQRSRVTTVNVFDLISAVTPLVAVVLQNTSSMSLQGPTPLPRGEIDLRTLIGVVGIVETGTAKSGASGRIGAIFSGAVLKVLRLLAVCGLEPEHHRKTGQMWRWRLVKARKHGGCCLDGATMDKAEQ